MTRIARSIPSRIGFTLMELLVAIAAAVLITLAIATLFTSAGETVSAGRRISTFNRAAALLEQQLRADFERMSREGFLVIRQEFAGNGPNDTPAFQPQRVPLYAGEPDSARRFRRNDEIVFFRRGSFTSSRSPLFKNVTARGSAAMVYYGQAARADLTLPSLSQPQFDAYDLPAYDLGLKDGARPEIVMPRLGTPGSINEFASDWILVRHQTILATPSATWQDYGLDPPLGTFGNGNYFPRQNQRDARVLADGDRQIALQPALPTVFRQVNDALRIPPPPATPSGLDRQYLREQTSPDYNRGKRYLSASGLFDVATTDFQEIRAYVTSMHDSSTPLPVPVLPSDLSSGQDVVRNEPAGWTPVVPDMDDLNQFAIVAGIQQWMRQALPGDTPGEDLTRTLQGVRMRAQTTPPDVFRVLDPAQFDPQSQAFEAADRLNDQLMLSAKNIAPRCSEFLVEWSFGQVDAQGQTKWYGNTILVDGNRDGVPEEARISRYSSRTSVTANQPAPQRLFIDRATGRQYLGQSPGVPNQHLVDDRLIHGARPNSAQEEQGPVTAHFGYTDPTYDATANPNPGDLEVIPWAWPTLIRVTITLVDPRDPTFEQSYQFVFETPSER